MGGPLRRNADSSLLFGLLVLHRVIRRVKKPVNEWLGMGLFFIAAMALPTAIESVARLVVLMDWVQADSPPQVTMALAGHLGNMIIPGVAVFWAYYGITGQGTRRAATTLPEPDDARLG